jgi:ferredoxin-NADP reductase
VTGARFELVVTRKVVVADRVVALTLADTRHGNLPAWGPGAHIDVVVAGTTTRQYSLCGKPENRREWTIAVLREPCGLGSHYVHDVLAVGDVVQVRGPRNRFPLVDSSRYLFFAGGIGITPILPMLDAADLQDRDWQLVYGGRSREGMAFAADLEKNNPRVTVWPEAEKGLIPLAELLARPRNDTAVYCCGPEPLLRAVTDACARWAPGTLHLERFTPQAAPTAQPVAGASPFTVELKRSGLRLSVPPDHSILEVVEEAGISILSSCRTGTCGTCEADVLAGQPDHRDSVLTEEEREDANLVMLCVSRSHSAVLVLDL